MRESEWKRRGMCERLGGAERVRGVGGKRKRVGARERTRNSADGVQASTHKRWLRREIE